MLRRILDILRGANFRCPHCEYEPDIPMDEFTVAEGMRDSDFTAYECPECGGTFEAVLCRCGAGYKSYSEFGEVRENDGAKDEYVCDCGTTLLYR